MSYYSEVGEDYLAHYGTMGMKWGRRLYQNKDGSLTPLGRLRYGGKSSNAKPMRKSSSSSAQRSSSDSDSLARSRSDNYESNEDFRKRVERAELESRYAQALTNKLRNEQEYYRMTVGEKKSALARGADATDKIIKIANGISAGIKVYDQYQKLRKNRLTADDFKTDK